MNVSVKDLTKIMKGQLILGNPRAMVTGASVDTRKLKSGSLFYALKGEKVDGHQFAFSACQQGAIGVVVSDLGWLTQDMSLNAAVIRVSDPLEGLRLTGQFLRNMFRGPVVGITGSNGKTTTKQMLAGILRRTGTGLWTQGNYNSQIGLPLVLSEVKDEDKWMVLEMGASAPGNIASLAEVARPTVGIITSIGPAHLASFGSIDRIAETKWELMESLPNDGTAVVPWAEPHLEKWIRVFKKKIVYFGENPACPVRAMAIQTGEKIQFRLQIGSNNATVRLPLPGTHNVMNALAAAAAAWVLGTSMDDIVAGLESFEPPQMRMEVLKHSSGAVFINDAYNANPASMAQALRSLMEAYPSSKRVFVMGSMLELGPDSDKYHFHLGTELGRTSLDRVVLVGNETKQAREGALSVGAPASKFIWAESHDKAADALKPFLKSDAVILFKGSRGVKLEEIIQRLTQDEKMEKIS